MRNIYLYYLIKFFWNFWLTLAIWTFFLTNYNSLNYSQAFFVMLLIWIIAFLFEIPSWAWCDRLWRKKIYLLWIIVSILWYLLWTFFWNFYIFIIAAILKWIWMAMNSGNIEAMIHDELSQNNKQDNYYKIQSNGHILMFVARFFWSLLSWILFLQSATLPYKITILFLIIEFLLVILIKTPKQVCSIKSTKTHYKESIKFFLDNKKIWIIILFLVMYCWFSNIYWFTYQIFFQNINISIQTIWWIFALAWIFSAVWSYVIKEIKDKLDDKSIVLSIYFLWSIWWIMYLFNNIYLWVFWVIISSIVAWMIIPFWNSIILQKAIDDKKSTLLSIFSAWITFSFWVLNIIVWVLLDKTNIINIYFITVLFIIILWILSLIKIN